MAMGVASCGDSWLDTTLEDRTQLHLFYKNELQASYALTGCYDQYQRTVSEGAWPGLSSWLQKWVVMTLSVAVSH